MDNVHYAGKCLQHSCADLQVALNNHHFFLNADKTKFMFFSRAKNIYCDSLIISTKSGILTERVTEYKYLGIWIDEKVNFKCHVTKLVLTSLLKRY